MLSVTLPCIFVDLVLDLALEEARSSQDAHQDNCGESNPYTADVIARLEVIEQRIEKDRASGVTLDAKDIDTISHFAKEWMSGREIERLTHDMIDA